jgi:hypothetical protein
MTKIRLPQRSRKRWITAILFGSIVIINLLYSFGIFEDAPSQMLDLPTSAILSFNQTLPRSLPCGEIPVDAVTFNPQFFMEHGPGRPFMELFKKQLEQDERKQRLLKVRFVQYTLSSEAKSCRPIYYHIHKNGGSTMNIKTGYDDDSSSTKRSRITHIETYYTPREQQLGREIFENQTMAILNQVRLDQTQQGPTNTMPVFTFLRDPVPRFLSSVGQALKLNKLRACTKQLDTQKRDAVVLLDCILSTIQEKESFLDEHLEPQAFELYHGMMGLGLNVQVMDLKSMDVILEQWLGSSRLNVSRRQTKGLMAGFNLSTSLLTTELIQRICRVYQMDVLLLQETKVSSSICTQSTMRSVR